MVGLLEFADPMFFRARESAPLVSEELALKQIFRDGRAVQFDKGRLGSGAQGLHGVRHQFLSRSRLSQYADRGVGSGDLLYLGEDFPDGGSGAYYAAQGRALKAVP